MRDTKRIDSKTAFSIFIIVILLTIVSYWTFGLRSHRSVVENALLSTSTLSCAFFIFLFVNLYRGAKLKDTVGKITDKFDTKKIKFLKELTPTDGDMPDIGEGIGGVIVTILVWLMISVVFGILLWGLGAVIWFSVLVFAAMLYWIFYRATRLVLKNSRECEGQFDLSFLYSLGYTCFYTIWIFAVIYISVAFC
jgi:hypothetical protein